MRKFMFISIFLIFMLTGCGVFNKTTTTNNTLPETNQTLKNNTEIYNFKGERVTSQQLYNNYKATLGLNALINLIDYELLSSYEDKVDLNLLRETIEHEKINNDHFYLNLAKAGIVKQDNETEAEFNIRVEEHYKLNFLRKAAALEKAKTQVDLDLAKAEYREDVCIITLQYNTSQEATDVLKILNSLSGKALEDKMIELWNNQSHDEDVLEEEDSYLDNQLVCNYERYRYNDYYANRGFRDLIFDGIEINQYNTTAKLLSNKYMIVYKMSEAAPKETYDQTQFENELLSNLTQSIITNSFIENTMREIRTASNLKIYDAILNKQYNSQNSMNLPLEESGDHYTVATYNNKTIAADDLFNAFKYNTITYLLDKINYQALSQISEIALTSTEKAAIQEQINAMKANFLSSGYGMTWLEYINTTLGASNENELAQLIELDELAKRYVLGYKIGSEIKFSGVNPVTESELTNRYDEWFEVNASHILFKIDKESDDIEFEKQRAELLAKQIIRGVDYQNDLATGLLSEDEFIRYDYDSDGILDQDEYFNGLNSTPASDYAYVFSKLARQYSDDGSAHQGGNLGLFGPGKMIKEFEDSTKIIAKSTVPYSLTPCETEFGYHVIYVQSITPKPALPSTYQGKTWDEIKVLIQSETDSQKNQYYDFMRKIETGLESEHIRSDQMSSYLSKLRNELHFTFSDIEMQVTYQYINNYLITSGTIDLSQKE